MNLDPHIPPACRHLTAALRAAVNGDPAPPDLADTADWPALFRQACEQGLATFIFPWLTVRLNDRFSLVPRPGEPPNAADWRARFFAALPDTLRRQNQLEDLLADLAAAHIGIVVLKGAWLSETVYASPEQRTMSDLDLLVREADRDACHARLLSLGYVPSTLTFGNPFAYDQRYRHPRHPLPVELHWHFASAQDTVTPPPDIAAIWSAALPARWKGHPLRALSPADQLAHAAQHILHHLFAMPLRGYLDIALLLTAHADALTPADLENASARWRTGPALAFILHLACGLTATPLPPALRDALPAPDPELLARAVPLIFDLPAARERESETTYLAFRAASPLARLRLAARRVFIPRAELALHDPAARRRWPLPLLWLRRALDLCRRRAPFLRAAAAAPGTPEARRLENAAARAALVRDLLAK